MAINLIYITAANADEAKTIARALVEERLAACANILGAMTSIYRWQGEIHEDQEVAMIIKTQTSLTAKAITRIKELHGYDCPCAVALAVDGGNPEFLDWIVKETS